MLILLMAFLALYFGYTTAAYTLFAIWIILISMGVGMYLAHKFPETMEA